MAACSRTDEHSSWSSDGLRQDIQVGSDAPLFVAGLWSIFESHDRATASSRSVRGKWPTAAEDRKNCTNRPTSEWHLSPNAIKLQIMGINRSGEFWVYRTMKEVTAEKPSMWSMDSTMPMAGRRNRITLPTSVKPLDSSCGHTN